MGTCPLWVPSHFCPVSTSHRSPPGRQSQSACQAGPQGRPPTPHPPDQQVPGSVSPATRPSGTLELPTPLIAAHQLYNYVADHASSYHMKPLRMARPGGPEHNEYALVSAWHR